MLCCGRFRYTIFIIMNTPFRPKPSSTPKQRRLSAVHVRGCMMRIRTRVLCRSTVLLAMFVGTFIPAASADLGNSSNSIVIPPSTTGQVSLKFSGLVDSVNSGTPATIAAMNDPIAGKLGYFTTGFTPSSGGANTEIYTFTGTASTQTFSFVVTAKFGSPTPPTGTTFSDQYPTSGTAGTYTITVSQSGSTTTLDISGTTIYNKSGAAGLVSLTLTSTTYTAGLNLPGPGTGSNTIGAFLVTSGGLAWDGPGFGTSELTVQDASVPEPSSLTVVVLTIATGSVGYLIRRKRWASQSSPIAPSGK